MEKKYIALALIIISVSGLFILNNFEQQRQQNERLIEELNVAKQTPIPTPTPILPDKNKVIVDTTPRYITLWYGKYYSNYEETPGVTFSIRNENDVPVKIIIDCSKAFPPGISCNLPYGNEFNIYPHSTINPSFKVMIGLFSQSGTAETGVTGQVDYKYNFGTPVFDDNTIVSCCSDNSMSVLARIPITVTPECNKNVNEYSEIDCDSASV